MVLPGATPRALTTKEGTYDDGSTPKPEPVNMITRSSSKGMSQSPGSIPENSVSTYSNSPARSTNIGFPYPQGLTKSDSTASAGRMSVTSHDSMPVIGTIPYGSLQIHRVSEDSTSEASLAESVAPRPVSKTAPEPPPKCLDNGDVFLLLDLPGNFTVGQDATAMTIPDANLVGIRDIPPGPHLLWVSNPDSISRCGYWYISKEKGQVRVKQWDRYGESLGEPASQFEVRDKTVNIETIYPKLIPHDYIRENQAAKIPPPPPPKDVARRDSLPEPDFAASSTLMWRQLTSAISDSFLDTVTGKKNVGEWLVETAEVGQSDSFPPKSTRFLSLGVASDFHFQFGQDISDLQLLSLASPGDFPADTSPRILAMLSQASPEVTESDMIAELQFTFLTGMHLGNFSCIEQWSYLVLKVILRAHSLIVSRPGLCRSLLRTLHAQMMYDDQYIDHKDTGGVGTGGVGAGILDIVPQTKDKLREALTVYKRRLNETLLDLDDRITQEQAAVGHAFADLESWFWRHGWDLRSDYVQEKNLVNSSTGFDSDDEYLPVVVQLDDEGRELGLVSWDHE